MMDFGAAQAEYVAVMTILAWSLLHALCFTGIVDLRETHGPFLPGLRAGIQRFPEGEPSPVALVATGAAFIALGTVLLISIQR